MARPHRAIGRGTTPILWPPPLTSQAIASPNTARLLTRRTTEPARRTHGGSSSQPPYRNRPRRGASLAHRAPGSPCLLRACFVVLRVKYLAEPNTNPHPTRPLAGTRATPCLPTAAEPITFRGERYDAWFHRRPVVSGPFRFGPLATASASAPRGRQISAGAPFGPHRLPQNERPRALLRPPCSPCEALASSQPPCRWSGGKGLAPRLRWTKVAARRFFAAQSPPYPRPSHFPFDAAKPSGILPLTGN